jgi:hopanoid C-3 methylase HpnR
LICNANRTGTFSSLIRRWRPDVIAFSGNYLANVPEIIDLARATRALLPTAFISVGGHSVSFIPEEILRHAAGAVDCVLIGEGETAITSLLDALAKDRANLREVPGCVTLDHRGPPPTFVKSLDDLLPARDIVRHRRKYFIGQLDPAASIEFSRAVHGTVSFCSAWTFYGRNYRVKTPERAVEELAQVREPGIFIVDDVAFIQAEHGMQLGEAIARRGIRKRYYLETRGDVLLRNKKVFELWKRLGLNTMFLGLEAIDEEGLKRYRKRITLSKNFEALKYARSLDINVAVNIMPIPRGTANASRSCATGAWKFPRSLISALIRRIPARKPGIPNRVVLRPATTGCSTSSTRCCRPSCRYRNFTRNLWNASACSPAKNLGWAALRQCAGIVIRKLLCGQTNFIRMLWKFNSVYRPELQLADHRRG